jgi:hypothetical protein
MMHVTDAVEDEEVLNNVNSKMLECIEELVTAIAATHNIIRAGREEVISIWHYLNGQEMEFYTYRTTPYATLSF